MRPDPIPLRAKQIILRADGLVKARLIDTAVTQESGTSRSDCHFSVYT